MARYNGLGNSYSRATAIALDASGNIYVTGTSSHFENDIWQSDYTTVKYNADGTQEWVANYNGPQNSPDMATALAIDCSGNVYVTGESGFYSNKDYATVKYNSKGVEQWVIRYNGPGNSSDIARDIAVDCSGNVYVTGTSEKPYDWKIYTTIKYVQTPSPDILRGDVNADHSIDVLDVVLAIRHIVGIDILTGGAFSRADCNRDGEIDAFDVIGIVNAIMGLGECDP